MTTPPSDSDSEFESEIEPSSEELVYDSLPPEVSADDSSVEGVD